MFDDIEKMEQEINEFRQNILASTQLVDGISKLIEENRKQQALIQQVSTDYQNSVKIITDNAIANIGKMETDTVESIKKEFSETKTEIIRNDNENINELKTLVNESLSETAKQISDSNKAYVDELARAEASMKTMQDDLTDKYTEFTKRMDNARVDEMLNTCTELKKSLELKTTLVIVGVVLLIILEAVQFIIK